MVEAAAPRQRRLGLVTAIVAAVLILDHVTKYLAQAVLQGLPTRSYLGDSLRLLYIENSGAFLSLGGSLSPRLRFWIFTVGVGVMLALLAGVVLRQALDRLGTVGFALVLGGGLSNWIDRLLNGGVVADFLNVGIGSLRTGIFNVADMAITGGIVVLLLESVLGSEEEEAEGGGGPGATG